MNSTDPKPQDQAKLAAIRAFFNNELMPLAQRLKTAGRPMFPTGAEPSLPTYFKTRTRTTMSRDDFAVPGVESPSAFAQAMQAYWQRSQFPEMAALAPTMARLAEQLRLGAGNDAPTATDESNIPDTANIERESHRVCHHHWGEAATL